MKFSFQTRNGEEIRKYKSVEDAKAAAQELRESGQFASVYVQGFRKELDSNTGKRVERRFFVYGWMQV